MLATAASSTRARVAAPSVRCRRPRSALTVRVVHPTWLRGARVRHRHAGYDERRTVTDSNANLRCSTIACDVSSVVAVPGRFSLGGWLCAPAAVDPGSPPSVVFCLAGGRCTTSYFDLDVRGHDGYSMARYLAGRGLVVVALDHLG